MVGYTKTSFSETSKFPARILTGVSAQNPSLRSGTLLLGLKAFLETVFVYLICFMPIENLLPAGDVETGLPPTAAVLRRGRWDGETAGPAGCGK